MKHLVFAAAVLASACEYVPTPTAPTPVPMAVTPRPAVQLAITISGPDSWWNDRLYVHVVLFDRDGVDTRGAVECHSTNGIFEPQRWQVESRGSLLIGVSPGATITCRHDAVEGRYQVTANDWRVIAPGPQPPRPTPTPTPPPAGPGGSGT